MKQVCILYNPTLDTKQKAIGEKLSKVLTDHGYQITLNAVCSVNDTVKLMNLLVPSKFQMVVTVNLAGFNLITTGNCSSMNHVLMNLVNYIDHSPELFQYNLSQRMNFTMSFIFGSESDADYTKNKYPHIRNVYWTSDIETFLPDYLERLDWRY